VNKLNNQLVNLDHFSQLFINVKINTTRKWSMPTFV